MTSGPNPATRAKAAAPTRFEALRFETRVTDTLPGDPITDNVPRQVHGACWTAIAPEPVAKPTLLGWSSRCAADLGIADPAGDTGDVAAVLAGNQLLPGMRPYAACYGGHQFGHWAGQLGDGRAITLGELIDPAGRRQELQLKGAGPTPYSRSADGRAVLRSSLREFLCSEAMDSLGVPTTRALSLVTTGDTVIRDMFYDGNPRPEPGAITCRVAPSFLRLGNYELPASRGDADLLRKLVGFTLDEYFPEFAPATADTIADWFAEVARRTAVLIAHWMRVGFVHGVMNTDNLSVLGLTIDYGPYGWLEGYDPHWTPNTTDAEGRRYCYGNQPQIGQWNLMQFARALAVLDVPVERLQTGLESYRETFHTEWNRMLAGKLGLSTLDGEDALVTELIALLQSVETDMTIFFRNLARVPVADALGDRPGQSRPDPAALTPAWYGAAPPAGTLDAWLRRYADAVHRQAITDEERRLVMDRHNPKYVPRNYLAQLAIDEAERGETAMLERLMHVLAHPYDEQPEHEDLAARRPEWARHRAGCSALSCSS